MPNMPKLITADMTPGVNIILLMRRIYELQQRVHWSAVFSHFPLHLIFISHFGMNLLKMKLCIKYVPNTFEFQ